MAYKDTSHVLKKKDELNSQRELLLQKQNWVEAFLNKFTLSKDEIEVLTGPDIVNISFFDALDRLQQILAECRVLLVSDSKNTGLEIMQYNSKYQESAYEKLFRWIQVESNCLKEVEPEISVELKRGILALRSRPFLFESFIQDTISIREKAISRAFQQALTVGGPGGIPKAIEIHAHDSKRYVGDMLAWVHQACLMERELIEGLLGLASSAEIRRKSASAPHDDSSPFANIEGYQQTQQMAHDILDKSFQETMKLLSMRLNSAMNDLSILGALAVAQVIGFYEQTVVTTIGKIELADTLSSLHNEAKKVFMDSIASSVSEISNQIEENLQPVVGIKEAVHQIKEILTAYESDVGNSWTQNELLELLPKLFDPILNHCDNIKASSLLETAIYKLNVYLFTLQSISTFPSTLEYANLLEKKIDEQVQTLIKEQRLQILRQSGLLDVTLAMEVESPPLARCAKTDRNKIVDALVQLDKFLITASLDVGFELSRLSSSQLVKKISDEGLTGFLESYKTLYNNVMNPINKYEFPSSILTRTVEDVETLLSLHSE